MTLLPNAPIAARPAGLDLGVLALLFTLLFLGGLLPVKAFNGRPFFPSPRAPAARMITYFQTRPSPILLSAFLHFGAAMVLGIRFSRRLGSMTA